MNTTWGTRTYTRTSCDRCAVEHEEEGAREASAPPVGWAVFRLIWRREGTGWQGQLASATTVRPVLLCPDCANEIAACLRGGGEVGP